MAIVRRGVVVDESANILWQDDGEGDFTASIFAIGAIQLNFPVTFLSGESYCVSVQPGYPNTSTVQSTGLVGHSRANTATGCRIYTANRANTPTHTTTFIEIFGETAD